MYITIFNQTLKKLYKLLETLIDLPEPSHTVTFGRPFAAIPGAKRHQTSLTFRITPKP